MSSTTVAVPSSEGVACWTVDPRRGYQDESQSRWQRGEQPYPEPPGSARFDAFGNEVPPGSSGRHGVPVPAGAPPAPVGTMGQWAGDPVPPVPVHRDPTGTTGQTYRVDARAARSATVSDGGSRKRRPTAGLVIGVVAVLAAAPVVRLLRDSLFGPSPSPSGVISSVLLLLALPLGALGLHGLVVAERVDDSPARVWLRRPVAYLPVALILLVAAGLAAA